MKKNKTKTPRTDDQIGYNGSTMSFVRIEFARSLELELQAAIRTNDELRAVLDIQTSGGVGPMPMD